MSDIITRAQVDEAAEHIRRHTEHHPTIGLILGSGLGSLADEIEDADAIPTDQIPQWPVSTVPGHTGRVVIGRFEDKTIIAPVTYLSFAELSM